jgi:hypothetical protein
MNRIEVITAVARQLRESGAIIWREKTGANHPPSRIQSFAIGKTLMVIFFVISRSRGISGKLCPFLTFACPQGIASGSKFLKFRVFGCGRFGLDGRASPEDWREHRFE